MGVSENSVPLNPMVLLIIIPIKWLFHWEYTQHFQTNPYGTHIVPCKDVVSDLGHLLRRNQGMTTASQAAAQVEVTEPICAS